MKKIILHISLVILFFSCLDQEDSIPEGYILESPVLYGSVEGPQSILLNWSSFQICNLFCANIVNATSYEVFQRIDGSDQEEIRIANLASGESSFLVSGLQPNTNYIFMVKAIRAGISNTTNSIMIMPHQKSDGETILEVNRPDFIRDPQISPDGNYLAFLNNLKWVPEQGRSVLSLYIKDLNTSEIKLINNNANNPSWSQDGQNLVFTTEDKVPIFDSGYRPRHVGIYSVENKTTDLVYRGNHRANFPLFGRDNNELLLGLDSATNYIERIWRFSLPDRQFEFLQNVPKINSVDHTSTSGASFSAVKGIFTISARVEKDNQYFSAFDIFGLDISDKNLLKLEDSIWDDQKPSISPFNGTLMAFISSRSGSIQVWLKNLQSGKVVQLTDFTSSKRISNQDISISWTDGGSSIVFNVRDMENLDSSLIKMAIPDI
jgi:hypothetical protein